MKKKLEKSATLSQLADAISLKLPEGVKPNVQISALESEYGCAGANTLTFLKENNPGALFRAKAAAVLVPKILRNLIPRDEAVQIIPVENPEEVFKRIEEHFD